MRAIRIHRFGAPDVIRVDDVAIPAPEAGEVLVRVHAAGVGPWDAWVRAGKSVLPQPLPLTLGADFSGLVGAVGPGVTDFARGDEVYGVTGPSFTGAYAELAIAPATMIARKPRATGHVEAASIPVVAVTAWQMLFDHAHVTRGQRVLIHGGAGNVGAYAVQLARGAGVHVIATATARDLETVRRLGADQVIDTHAARFEDVAGEIDAVIDTLGGEMQRRSFAVLKRGGIMVSAVSEPDADEARRREVRATFMLVQVTRPYLEQIAARVDRGELVPRIGTVLPLADAVTAHEMLDGLRPRPSGKIVLRVAEG